jgi:hypothetical protein
VDAQRLEQVAQAQLQAADQRVRGSELGRALQRTRGLDVQQQADRRVGGHAVGRRGLFDGLRGGHHVVWRLGLGQVDEGHARLRHRLHVGQEVRRVQRVHAHDQPLGAAAAGVALQRRAQRLPRLGLARLDDRVLEIERQCVGVAGQRLGEQLGARTGHEQLASHAASVGSPGTKIKWPDLRSHARKTITWTPPT